MVPQCVRCQQFGHTRTYCNHAPRCVRCGHDHDTTTCTKSRDTSARCANCKGDHPANYRGCEVLKNLRKQKAARHNRPQQTYPPPLSTEAFPALEQKNDPQEQVEQQRPSKPQMRTLQNATSPPQNKPSSSGMRREATQQPPSAGNQLTPQLYQLLNGLNSLIQPIITRPSADCRHLVDRSNFLKMRNISDNTEWYRRTSQPDVVISGDVALQDVQQRSRSNSTYSADLETAITKTGCGKFHIALALLTIPVSCTSGFDTASMSYIIPMATVDLGLRPIEKALLQSSCYAGIITAGVWWGFMSDAFGRKKIMVTAFFLDVLMNILVGSFPVLPLMVLFKFLSGIMTSGSQPIFTTYIAEVFSLNRRDSIILSIGVYGSIGQILLSILATVIMPMEIPSEIPLKSWQIFQMVCCLPALISGIGCLFFLESPKFLADKGNHEGALKVFQTIYSINTGNQSSTYPVKRLNHKSRTSESESNLSKILKALEIFRPPFLLMALVMPLLYLFAITCYNILHLWLPEMLMLASTSELDPREGMCPILHESELRRSTLNSTEDLNEGQVFSQMIWGNTGCLIGQLLLILIVNYVHTKIILIGCTLLAAISSMLLPFMRADYIMYIATIYMALYQVNIYCCLNIVIEIFPTRMRATGVAIMMITGKIGALVVNFIMVKIGYSYCEYLFFGTGSITICAAGLALLIPKKPLEDNSSKGN